MVRRRLRLRLFVTRGVLRHRDEDVDREVDRAFAAAALAAVGVGVDAGVDVDAAGETMYLQTCKMKVLFHSTVRLSF